MHGILNKYYGILLEIVWHLSLKFSEPSKWIPAYVHGWKWYLILMVACKLRTFQTESWGEYFGPRGKRMGNWESFTMRNFIVCTVHLIRVIKSKRLRLTGHVAWVEEESSAFKMLIGKFTGRRPLGRPRRWEDNARIDIKEIGINTRDWVDSTQDRDYWRVFVNEAFNLRIT